MTNYADQISYEYRVSERKTLRRGDVFRANGGPYYVTANGDTIRMGARGPLIFIRYAKRGEQEWIEAHSTREGTMVVLALTERPSIMPGSLITRPYTIGSKAREATRRRVARGVASVDARRALAPSAPSAPCPAPTQGFVAQGQKTLDAIFAKNA